MASTYSPGLGIELPGTGDQAGVWGNTTNTNLGTLIEQAISGYVTQAVATGTDTTITIPNGATGVARNMYIELTGSGGASTNLIVPANKKLYFIFNNTSSGQVTVKVSGQTGISVPNGKKMVLVSNGTDIVTAENYVASLSSDNLSLTGTLAVGSTSTFTGAATFTANPVLNGGTANGVLYLNGSKVATSGSALTFDGTNLGLGVTPSTWDSGRRVFQIGGNGALWGQSSGSGFLFLSNNLYYDGTNFRYLNTAASAYYTIASDSSHRWYQAVSGTAGNVITVGDPKMILDLSGNLGIGTASPGARLEAFRNSSGEVARFTAAADGVRSLKFVSSDNVGSGAIWTRDIDSAYAQHRWAKSGTPLMVLDESGSLGLNTTTPSSYLSGTAKLVAYANANSQNNILVRNDSNGASSSSALVLNASGNTWGIEIGSAAKNSNALTFQLDYGITNSTQMILTSSGQLGIGTASPGYKLDVDGTINGRGLQASGTASLSFSANKWMVQNEGTSIMRSYACGADTSTYGRWQHYTAKSNGGATLVFEADGSGNLGLGVTPSAWVNATASQVGFGAAISSRAAGNTASDMTHNAFWDGSNWKYIASSVGAARYQMTGANVGSTHAWFVSAGGTAGNAITFTTAMTLDASGRLGIGTSSPVYPLVVSAAGAQGLEFDATAVSSAPLIQAYNRSGSAYIQLTYSALQHVWQTSGTERGRFTSGGVLCVNSTSNVGSEITLFKQTAGPGSPVTRTWNDSTSGDNEFIEFATEASYTARGSITYNRAGGLVAYNTTSDYRAKDIYGLLNDSGEVIDALKVYRGKMHGATMERPMLIAHEAQEAAPYAVTGEKDAVNDNGDPIYQQMDTSSLVPLLIAEIQSLRSRVAALEAK